MKRKRSFTTRATLALALLLLAYGSFVALLGRQLAAEHEQESLQRLSHGLARHIVEHWPEIARADSEQADAAARELLLSKLMVANPGVQVYVLDADARVRHYIGQPGMVREEQVDLAAVRAFLAGAELPLRGTDPMGSGVKRIFSAAMFAPRAGDARPPGYLYIVLDGDARSQLSGPANARRIGWGAALAAGMALAVTLAAGLLVFRQLSLPLRRLAARLREYQRRGVSAPAEVGSSGDEVHDIEQAFAQMAQRLDAQAEREQRQAAAHRETMASVAHDLRTPLTALHGHLEALAGELPVAARERVLAAALGQSDKVRRLSQQLFELATLQSTDQVLHRERFRLDELVTDAVHKFDVPPKPAPVLLHGAPPDRLELDGDLQLIERALSNLIDNAMRHAPSAQPVRVSLRNILFRQFMLGIGE
jgi:hypothetical protein